MISNAGLKKYLLLASIFVLGVFAAAAAHLTPRTVYTSAEVMSQEDILKIKEERTEYIEEVSLGELYYGETKLPYSDYNRTMYLSVADGVMPQEEQFHILLEEDNDNRNVVFERFPTETEWTDAVADGTGFPILIYDDKQYMECQVVFTGMPIMDIDFTDELDGIYTVVTMTLQSGHKDNGNVLVSEAKMRARGGVSINYPKLGFKLKLIERDHKQNSVKREEALLGLRKSDTWNLSALYADDTKVRDKVAIDLWAKMSEDGIPFDETFGTRMEYVEVVINDSYQGLYALMEPIDDQQLGISDHGQSGLCEYYYKKENEEIGQESDFVFDVKDTVPEKEDTVADMVLAGLELKNGNGHQKTLAWEPVRRYMEMIREESYAEDAPTLLDMENVADVWIYIQAIMGVDNRAKNLYYCAKVVDGEYKIYFVPWDMDMTWGNVTDLSQPLLLSYYTYPVDKIMNWIPATQLIEENVGGIRKIIKERWKALRQEVLSDESVTGNMEETFAYIHAQGAYARDKARWKYSPHADDLTQLTDYAWKRLKVLDAYIMNEL